MTDSLSTSPQNEILYVARPATRNIQQPAAIRIEAIMNIMVTGSPNNKIDNSAPINGGRA